MHNIQPNNSPQKLFLISSLQKNFRSSSIQLTSSPLSHRQKLLKHRQFHLDKIKHQISTIIQHQLLHSHHHSVNYQFYKPQITRAPPNFKLQTNRHFNGKIKRKRKAIFQQKSVEDIKQHLGNLSNNLLVHSKKLSFKQQANKQKQQQKQKQKQKQKSYLPQITSRMKPKIKFNFMYEGKIQPWRYRNEEMSAFQLI